MKSKIALALKGVAMGAANVIPGVSGGTIALITGIFEEFIHSIKSFGLTALKLLLKGKFKEFAIHVNLKFLIPVLIGVAISILTIAKLFGYLFDNYPTYIWSFFFGLILASVYYVGKTVDKWNLSTIISLVIGTAVAFSLSILTPSQPNDSFLYLIVCGVVAACSMILPGLSGSFVLILMGNYRLIMIDAVNELNVMILLPVVIGAGGGLVAFSHFLSWVFKKYKNQTIALLTGFIFGSLGVLWPWKQEVFALNPDGSILIKDGEKIVEGYNWLIPQAFETTTIIAILLMIAGIITIAIMEKAASKAK